MSITIKMLPRKPVFQWRQCQGFSTEAVTYQMSQQKVNETIARLNYSPNFLGRNLRKCETNVILVIMPTSEHSLYSKIVMGMQDYAGQVGYDIITAVSYSTSTAETRQMNMLLIELLTVLSFLALSMTQLRLISSQRIITLLCAVRA